MKLLQNYKHIIWDWNGTILNDIDMSIDIVNELLVEKRLDKVEVNTYREIFDIPVENYYKTLGFDFAEESFRDIGKRWMYQYESRKYNEARLNTYAKELIEEIHKSGISQSVLSAYPQDTLEELVSHFNLTGYFDYLVGASDIYAHGKLDEGKHLMNMLQLDKGEAVLIGDTIHDYEVAKAIGADVILTAEGHQSFERLSRTGCKVVQSLKELL